MSNQGNGTKKMVSVDKAISDIQKALDENIDNQEELSNPVRILPIEQIRMSFGCPPREGMPIKRRLVVCSYPSQASEEIYHRIAVFSENGQWFERHGDRRIKYITYYDFLPVVMDAYYVTCEEIRHGALRFSIFDLYIISQGCENTRNWPDVLMEVQARTQGGDGETSNEIEDERFTY